MAFTAGDDARWDMELAFYDAIGSIAHARMLGECGLLDALQEEEIVSALRAIIRRIEEGSFRIEEGVEDVHSQIELELTRTLGETGKRIHSARSRNDQVLLDIRLCFRDRIRDIVGEIANLFELLSTRSEETKDVLIPGYTHFQPAMPSSFGLWFGAYAESLIDDVVLCRAAYRIVDRNPLGSAAGYGSTFPIRRQRTTELLGFGSLHYNSISAQMGRGKSELVMAQTLASVASTVSRFAMDVCLFASPNFGFIRLPADASTGSSIMPHKRNPDVFELVRARCNRLTVLPSEVAAITTNLPSGYHRDYQTLKGMLFPAIQTLISSLRIVSRVLPRLTVVENILDDQRYAAIRSVERIEELVWEGYAFRDAYRIVSDELKSETLEITKPGTWTHEGSIGNLCTEEIRARMASEIQGFPFEQRDEAFAVLTGEKE